MIVKRVQFQTQPETIHYYQYPATCDYVPKLKQKPVSPATFICATHPSSLTKKQHPPSIATKTTIVKSNPPVISKRHAIPPLDFTRLHHHALQPHTTNTDIETIALSRPLPPPNLSIDTLHHTPQYYTALSTCYF